MEFKRKEMVVSVVGLIIVYVVAHILLKDTILYTKLMRFDSWIVIGAICGAVGFSVKDIKNLIVKNVDDGVLLGKIHEDD